MLNKLNAVSQKLTPGFRKIIRNVSWLSAEYLLSLVLTFLVGVYVVRYLGPESYGKLSYSISFVTLFGAIANLGLDSIVVRNLVQDENATKEILGTAFILKLLGSLATIAVVNIATLFFIDERQLPWISLVIVNGFLFQSFDVIDFWLQSKVLSSSTAIVRSTQLILSSAAKFSFIALRLSLAAFVWLMLVDAFSRAVGMILLYFKYSQSIFTWKVSFPRALDLLKDSFPLILSGMMVTIYMKIDQVMLGNMASNDAVGNYAAAVRFSEIWYFLPVTVCSSVFPAIIQAKQTDEKKYIKRLQQLYDLMAWLSIAIAVPMTFLSGKIIIALLGEKYIYAGSILSLHIWAGPFVFLGVARGKWLTAENLNKFNFFTTALGAALNVVLNFLLIPKYVGNGAAFATVISYAVASYISCWFYPELYHTGWMLSKALCVPLRLQQNLAYLNKIRRIFL